MTEKSTLKFIKTKFVEMGLRDKMDFFIWVMEQLRKELNQKDEPDSKHIKET